MLGCNEKIIPLQCAVRRVIVNKPKLPFTEIKSGKFQDINDQMFIKFAKAVKHVNDQKIEFSVQIMNFFLQANHLVIL